ncbi:MAG: hypothetical protein IKN80_05425 [Clostridiales bacterium]|nr:hypothetical protein [Clostridiales bacterium]
MKSISDYSDLIKLIPAECQSSIIKKAVWDRFNYDVKIKEVIFGSNEEVEISRADIFSEKDIKKKIVMILMWGYPSGGRGSNIQSVLTSIDDLVGLLSAAAGKNFGRTKANELFKELGKIGGLGVSTWTKFLYFFKVSVDSNKCQIFDMKIVNSLNKKQFSELALNDIQEWRQNNEHYYRYIVFADELARDLGVSAEQVELFLFYFNLNYKF